MPGIFGSGLRGHGGEAFVKHIADHMHTQKYESGGGKTLQELGFKYFDSHTSVANIPCGYSRPRSAH
eukprot:SAG31_NODE_2117_length_6412_cov_7.762712_2_plen_67_part_00